MNVTHLNRILQEGIRDNYQTSVGETIDVALPRLPITGDTEFIQLSLDTTSLNAFETALPDHGEGNALPRHLHACARQAGTDMIRITAVDALTNQPIADVDVVEISLTAIE